MNGYQIRTGIVPEQLFAVENIVILREAFPDAKEIQGYCVTTCTIFSEFVTSQADIKTVAVGGRP